MKFNTTQGTTPVPFHMVESYMYFKPIRSRNNAEVKSNGLGVSVAFHRGAPFQNGKNKMTNEKRAFQNGTLELRGRLASKINHFEPPIKCQFYTRKNITCWT